MSNRYWISVGALAVVAALAGVYVARMVTQPAVPVARVGHLVPGAARAAGVQPGGHTRNAPPPRPRCAAIPRWCSSVSRIARTSARRRWRCSRACRSRRPSDKRLARPQGGVHQRRSRSATRRSRSGLGTSLHSARDFIGLTGSAPEIVKATQRLRRGGGARRTRRRRLHHGSLRRGVRARFAGAHRRGLHATAIGGGARRATWRGSRPC